MGAGEKAQSEMPLVICNPPNALPEQQKCNWTAHVHAIVRVFKNGAEMPVRFEEGKLEGQTDYTQKHWQTDALAPIWKRKVGIPSEIAYDLTSDFACDP